MTKVIIIVEDIECDDGDLKISFQVDPPLSEEETQATLISRKIIEFIQSLYD